MKNASLNASLKAPIDETVHNSIKRVLKLYEIRYHRLYREKRKSPEYINHRTLKFFGLTYGNRRISDDRIKFMQTICTAIFKPHGYTIKVERGDIAVSLTAYKTLSK